MIIDSHAHLVPPSLLAAVAPAIGGLRLTPNPPYSLPIAQIFARVNDYGLAIAVGRITDALIAVSRLVCAGHVARYPQAKIVVPMGAAGLPFLLGRLRRNHAITPGVADPAQALRHVYTDTILHDPRVLRFVADTMGAGRIMLGSDMPFPIGDAEPAKIVQAAGLSPAEVASITGGLARTLFRL